MKKCKNCGYINDDKLTKCEKCNLELSGSMMEHYSMSTPNDMEAILAGTISDSKYELLPTCPNCHAKLIDSDVTECPYCHCNLGASESPNSEKNHSGGEKPTTPRKQHVEPAYETPMPNNPQGTINPWAKKKISKCSLNSIDDTTVTAHNYSGENIVLNRFNTNAGNNAISQESQAVLTKEIDGWYIIDKSRYQSTCVVAKHKIKLEDGDIIVMGDERFEFHCDN